MTLKRNLFYSLIKELPTIRLFIPYTIGIFLGCHLGIKYSLGILFTSLGSVILLLYAILSNPIKFSNQALNGIGLSFVFLGIGVVSYYFTKPQHHPSFFGNKYQNGDTVICVIAQPLVSKQKSLKTIANVSAIRHNGKWSKSRGLLLLYIKNDSLIPNIGYGSQLIIKAPLQPIISNANPGNFDYASFIHQQGIYYRAWLHKNDFIVLPKKNGSIWFSTMFQIRQKVLGILATYIHSKDVGLAEALLIGYRDNLEWDLVQAYSKVGIVHIIAISGMHLAMISALLSFIFSNLKRFKAIKYIEPLTIVLTLWAFSFLAGNSPSVMRGAVMFTYLIIGKCLGRKITLHNSLLISAFTLLVFNPMVLWDIGFQLSYAAVLGISLFTSFINKLLPFKNKLFKNVWMLCSVTLAAQVFTLPIVIYHFHQLPTLFLVTNILAVPFSGLILYGEIALLILSFIPVIANLVGVILESMIGIMNNYIFRLSHVPFSLLEGLYITPFQFILLSLSTACLGHFLLRKARASFFIGLASLSIFFSARCVDFWQKSHQAKFIVYNIPNSFRPEAIIGRKSYPLNINPVNNILNQSHLFYRIKSTDTSQTVKSPHYFTFNGKKILFIYKNSYPANPQNKMKIDAIILTNNPNIGIKELVTSFDCPLFIFSPNNSYKLIHKWKEDCQHLHLKSHSVSENGAYILDLDL